MKDLEDDDEGKGDEMPPPMDNTNWETSLQEDDFFDLFNLDDYDLFTESPHHTESEVSLLASLDFFEASSQLIEEFGGELPTDISIVASPERETTEIKQLSPVSEENMSSSEWRVLKRTANKEEGPEKKKAKSTSTSTSVVATMGMKCQHCGMKDTPQWRKGPSGPKTLCNACGIRYQSGNLLPEYRPTRSPTFSPELHSSSRQKVVDIRKKKKAQSSNSNGEQSWLSISSHSIRRKLLLSLSSSSFSLSRKFTLLSFAFFICFL